MGEATIYENVFNRTLDDEQVGLAAMARQLRLRYEGFLVEEGAPENTEKRQRAMERVNASHLHTEYQRLCGELEAEADRQDKLLNVLAPKIELNPHETMYRVGQVSVDAHGRPPRHPWLTCRLSRGCWRNMGLRPTSAWLEIITNYGRTVRRGWWMRLTGEHREKT